MDLVLGADGACGRAARSASDDLERMRVMPECDTPGVARWTSGLASCRDGEGETLAAGSRMAWLAYRWGPARGPRAPP